MDSSTVRYRRPLSHVVARGSPAASCCRVNPRVGQDGGPLAQLAGTVLPKSSLAKAVSYARNQGAALRRYTEDGRLTIDNNVSERTLRHQAIGRKNWLFLGSEAAGPRAAVLCTILAGAKRHRIEPWSYVRDLLLRLHAVAVVDYLQLVTPDDRRLPREQQVAKIVRALKETARQYDIPILCLCQLNRQADGDDVPRLSHLRESGAIEQDADVVLFLSKHEPTDAEPHNAALTIAKNRNGETGPLRLDWDAGRTRFSCFAGNNDFADLG